MRILVTGSLGMIGGELSQQLIVAGHEVLGNDDLSHNCYEQSEIIFTKFFPCRVEQLHRFSHSIGKLELIVHCASPVGHARLTPEAEIAWQIVSDTQAMLDLAVLTGARLILLSSSEVLTYRGETDIRAQYSLGKLTSEAMCLGHPKVDCRIVRPYNVTGKRQRADGGFVMARFRDQALAGQPLTVFGSGQQVRHFLHVTDFCRFLALLAERWPEKKQWSVFNPANAIMIAALAEIFAEVNGATTVLRGDGATELGNATWRDTPERPLDMYEYILACGELGLRWTPQISLLDIVHEHLGLLVKAGGA